VNKRFDGAVGLSTLTVRHADTAIALGSGDVTVLGTPRLIALAEAATVAALQDRLDQQETSVGIAVSIEHLGASPLGSEVVASACVIDVSESKITFSVEVRDGDRIVGKGQIVRAVVDRVQFMARIAALTASQSSSAPTTESGA